MAKIRDRTEDFKDAVNRGDLSLGFNELESVGTLEQFFIKDRKDYVDPHRTTEEERDSIEHEVSVFVKACKEQIDILKTSITDEESNSKGSLGIRADNANTDTIAHKHGVVLILSERLHSVPSQFDQLRAVQFQDAINRAMPRGKPKRTVVKSSNVSKSEPTSSEIRDHGEIQTEPMKLQHQQLLDDETHAL